MLPIDTIKDSWLNDTSSLTQRLRDLTQNKIELKLISDGWDDPVAKTNWLREIHWVFEDQIWVIGRVTIPASSLSGAAEQLMRVGNHSIGDLLKTDPNLHRDIVDIKEIEPSTWSRRSLFKFHQAPLEISEVFMPEFFSHPLVSQQHALLQE